MSRFRILAQPANRLQPITSCENGNKKVNIFSRSQVSFRNKTIVFSKKSSKKHYGGLRTAATCLVRFSSPLQCLVGPVFTLGVLRLNKLVSVKFNKCLKACQSCGRAPKWLICMFTIKPLNISPTAYDFS